MTVVDREQDLRVAIAAILDASADLQSLCGRSAGLAIERDAISPDAELPIVAVAVVSWEEATGKFGLLLTGCAKDGQTARLVVRAAVDALTWSAFHAHALDIFVAPAHRRDVEIDPERALPIATRLQLEDYHEADADLSLLDVTD